MTSLVTCYDLYNLFVWGELCNSMHSQSTLRPGYIGSLLPVGGHLIQHMGIEINQKPPFCIVHIFYKPV